MAENNQDGIAIFDTLFTNNRICMMKIILPFLPTSFQKSIAVYIKYLELQYTLQYFTRHPQGLSAGQNNSANESFDSDAMWDNLLPYCSPAEKQNIQQMRNMIQTFHNMKDMMEMFEMMKELFPDGFGSPEGMNFPPGFGSPEGMSFPPGFSPELLAQFSTLFNTNTTKGE